MALFRKALEKLSAGLSRTRKRFADTLRAVLTGHHRDDVIETLALDFETALQLRREQLLQPRGVNFFIRPGDLVATRAAGGTIQVSGVVRFRPDARVESLKGFRLSAGEVSSNHRFGEPRIVRDGSSAPTFVYEVRAAVTPTSSADSVQVQVFHGGGDDRSRTFTLALGGSAAASNRATSAP